MTAAIVPSWITAVNAAPGSCQPSRAGTIRRWPLLETGRNSVRPWTMPSTAALIRSTPPPGPLLRARWVRLRATPLASGSAPGSDQGRDQRAAAEGGRDRDRAGPIERDDQA